MLWRIKDVPFCSLLGNSKQELVASEVSATHLMFILQPSYEFRLIFNREVSACIVCHKIHTDKQKNLPLSQYMCLRMRVQVIFSMSFSTFRYAFHFYYLILNFFLNQFLFPSLFFSLQSRNADLMSLRKRPKGNVGND